MAFNNKLLMRRAMEEVVSIGNLDYIGDALASDFVGHDTAGNPFGREDFLQGVIAMLAAFSDREVSIEDQIEEGDKVVTRWSVTATHSGEFMGIPATGNAGNMTGIAITRIVGGKIVEQWEVTDDLGFLKQLGVMSAPEMAPA